MANKGVFIQLEVSGRVVFSCAIPRMEESEFLDVWAMAGKRMYWMSVEKMAGESCFDYGQIRLSPITD